MSRIGGLLQALLGASLLVFGLLADRALVAQGASARTASGVALDETARLTAASVPAALAAIEAGVLKGRSDLGVQVERLAMAPDRAAVPSGRPYSRHTRSELAELLTSTAVTPNGLNPGTRGWATCRFSEVPWDDALDRILSANRLAYRLNGPVLHIGRIEELGPADQKFTGQPISLDFQEVDLAKAFGTIALKGGGRADVKPKVAGRVTLKLNEVPWDQAFDILARVNGLRCKRQGNVIAVGFAEEL